MTTARIFIVALLLSGAASPAPTGWKHFSSTKYRYNAWYPPGWNIVSAASDSLEIINFKRSDAVAGSFIPEQGADLEVGPTERPGTISEQINAELTRARAVSPLVDQTLSTGLRYADSPGTLRQVEYYENYGTAADPVLQHVTTYWCEVHNRVFAVILIYWRDNKDAKLLEGEALAVARSLRISR